jgi:sorting nexin-1/2
MRLFGKGNNPLFILDLVNIMEGNEGDEHRDEMTADSPEVRETNSKVRMSFSVDSRAENHAISISIKDYVIRDGLTKKIYYNIIGTDKAGGFEISRRYTEFRLLRNVLSNSWPGFYIPKIPSKQKLGNLEPAFIDKRRKLLELFLKKVSNLEYIYESEIFQSFLREKNDFKNIAKNFSNGENKTSEKIVSKFTRFANESLLPEIEEKFSESEKIFKGALEALSSLISQVSVLVEVFDGYESDLIDFMTELNDLGTAFTGKNMDKPVRDAFFNPYVIILDWATAEILDLEAICEAIESRKKYENVVHGIEKNLESSRKNLLKIQSGKKSLSQLFKKETKEDREAKSQTEIETLEKNLSESRLCFKVMSLRLAKKEIPMFKTAKLETYKHIMKVFASASIQELTFLVQQAESLQYFID